VVKGDNQVEKSADAAEMVLEKSHTHQVTGKLHHFAVERESHTLKANIKKHVGKWGGDLNDKGAAPMDRSHLVETKKVREATSPVHANS